MVNIPIPAGVITNTELSAAAAISASKVVHRDCCAYGQAVGSVVASATQLIRAARASGVLKEFRVAWQTAPTGGDKKFTVDLQQSTGGGAFATVLSAVVTVDNSKSDAGSATGTITASSFVIGDLFKVVVTVSGSTGTQGYGMIAEAFFEEGE